MKSLIVAMATLLYLPLVLAQEQTERPPATKLQAFQARTGVVLIRGYTTVGTIRGTGGSVSIDAREFRDAANPNSKATGIAIEVKESGRLERSSTSYVDSDEIDSLIKGIDYISKIGKDVTKLQNFEADYRTKDDLRITVFNDSRGGISTSITSGRIGRANCFLELKDLERLRELIVTARTKL